MFFENIPKFIRYIKYQNDHDKTNRSFLMYYLNMKYGKVNNLFVNRVCKITYY